ncbi:MAG: hypothetical protein GY745_20450 [Actinomycetia bacterium]|nr:hypothetical protein [Actinomycetes bacterium]
MKSKMTGSIVGRYLAGSVAGLAGLGQGAWAVLPVTAASVTVTAGAVLVSAETAEAAPVGDCQAYFGLGKNHDLIRFEVEVVDDAVVPVPQVGDANLGVSLLVETTEGSTIQCSLTPAWTSEAQWQALYPEFATWLSGNVEYPGTGFYFVPPTLIGEPVNPEGEVPPTAIAIDFVVTTAPVGVVVETSSDGIIATESGYQPWDSFTLNTPDDRAATLLRSTVFDAATAAESSNAVAVADLAVDALTQECVSPVDSGLAAELRSLLYPEYTRWDAFTNDCIDLLLSVAPAYQHLEMELKTESFGLIRFLSPVPGISLAKTTSEGHSNGAGCPGTELVSGSPGDQFTYCYAVTNSGNTDVTVSSLEDPDLGLSMADVTLLSGSATLAPGEAAVWYFESTITAATSSTATAVAEPFDSGGGDLSALAPVDSSDASGVEAEAEAGSVIGLLWLDRNDDGLAAVDESRFDGVAVDLMSAGADGLLGTVDDVAVATGTTDEQGGYEFVGVAPGQYEVRVEAGSVEASHVPSFETDEVVDGRIGVDVVSGRSVVADFGYWSAIDLVIDIEPYPQAKDTIDWILTIRNEGDTDLFDPYTIENDLPDYLTFAAVETPPGWTCTVGDKSVRCVSPGGLAVGEDAEIKITTTIAANSPAELVNHATVLSAGAFDTDLTNNDDRAAAKQAALTGTASAPAPSMLALSGSRSPIALGIAAAFMIGGGGALVMFPGLSRRWFRRGQALLAERP